MARYSGSSGKHWSVFYDDSVSEDATGYTIGWSAGMQANDGYSFQTNYNKLSWSWSAGDGGSTTKSVNLGSNGSVVLATGSCRIAKTHEAQHPALGFTLDRTASSWLPGTASCSNVYYIAPLASHAIAFDDNGGSGGPGSTTKWYGEDLAIPSTVPTRASYSFVGWSRSKTATSADYAAGQSYFGTEDASYTLYAVWHLDHVLPTVSVKAYRVASDTGTGESVMGEYAYISVQWSKGSTSVTGITVSDSGSHAWTPADGSSSSGDSGTFAAHAPLSASDTIAVTATVSDGVAQAVRSATIGPAAPPIDIGNEGRAVGILESVDSSKTGLHVGGKMWCGSTQDLRVLYYTSKPDESAIPVKPCIVVLADGSMYLVT